MMLFDTESVKSTLSVDCVKTDYL